MKSILVERYGILSEKKMGKSGFGNLVQNTIDSAWNTNQSAQKLGVRPEVVEDMKQDLVSSIGGNGRGFGVGTNHKPFVKNILRDVFQRWWTEGKFGKNRNEMMKIKERVFSKIMTELM